MTDSWLVQIAAQLLRPVAGLLMANGLRFQEIVDALKVACVQVAKEQLQSSGQQVNISRLSILTGLQRKDINRILNAKSAEIQSPNLLNRIIGQWQTDPQFIGPDQKPRPLNFEGTDSEFTTLVRTVSADINPYTVLFGLEHSGAVTREGKQVTLQTSIYNISKSTADGLALLAQDSDALHSAVSENLFKKPAVPNLHLTTLYDNVAVEHLDEIRTWLLDQGTTLHEQARAYIGKFDKDANPRLHQKQGGGKVTLTAFSFVTKEEEGR